SVFMVQATKDRTCHHTAMCRQAMPLLLKWSRQSHERLGNTRPQGHVRAPCMALRALLLVRMLPTEHLLRGASAPGVRASALPSPVSSPPAARARRESSRAACRGAVAGGAHGAAYHSCTGVRMGAPVAFSSTTTTLAGAVVLALRPTTCTSVGPS